MVVVGCCVIVEQVQGAGSRCRMAECQEHDASYKIEDHRPVL